MRIRCISLRRCTDERLADASRRAHVAVAVDDAGALGAAVADIDMSAGAYWGLSAAELGQYPPRSSAEREPASPSGRRSSHSNLTDTTRASAPELQRNDVVNVVDTIKRRFEQDGPSARVPLLKGGGFTAEITAEGIVVNNLGAQPLLPWVVFEEAVALLVRRGGRADRGDAMKCRLGDDGLSVDSVEGHIAAVVYGQRRGDTVFRRITPVACILIWRGFAELAQASWSCLDRLWAGHRRARCCLGTRSGDSVAVTRPLKRAMMAPCAVASRISGSGLRPSDGLESDGASRRSFGWLGRRV